MKTIKRTLLLLIAIGSLSTVNAQEEPKTKFDVGVFATDGGLFYGGGFHLLGVQAIGVLAIGARAIVMSFIILYILKKTIGLRVFKDEEVDGLDIHEHKTNVYNN